LVFADDPPWTELVVADSLKGWVQRGGHATYAVENGEIVGRSAADTPNSFLCTEREYGDFALEFEVRIDPRMNSGVQIRSHAAAGYRDGVVHGYQVEIDPSDRAWSGGLYDEQRRGWLADLKDNAAARQAFKRDDWNQYRVEARGELIRTWINGVPAAELRDGLARYGFIALQVHATKETAPIEVRWRKLRIQDRGVPGRAPPAGATLLLGLAGDLSHWRSAKHPEGPAPWELKDGALEVKPGSGDIATREPYGDCALHVEFAVDDNGQQGQANGNSGVYLQGRYEVQILNSSGQPPADNVCGAIYGVKAAEYNLARPAGEWQAYDIEFRAPRWDAGGQKTARARLTVYHNGVRIHEEVEVPGPTGAGAAEAPAAAPLRLQDHGARVRFRNVWIQPGAPPASGADEAAPASRG
jgi:hypothetical protein